MRCFINIVDVAVMLLFNAVGWKLFWLLWNPLYLNTRLCILLFLFWPSICSRCYQAPCHQPYWSQLLKKKMKCRVTNWFTIAIFLMLLHLYQVPCEAWKGYFLSLAEEHQTIKYLIHSGSGAALCPAKQYNSYTIYGLSSVQVAEKLLGHTCQLIQPLDYEPHCL